MPAPKANILLENRKRKVFDNLKEPLFKNLEGVGHADQISMCLDPHLN